MTNRHRLFISILGIITGLALTTLPLNASAAKGSGSGKNRRAGASQQRNKNQSARKAGASKAAGNAQRKAAASTARKATRSNATAVKRPTVRPRPGTGSVGSVGQTSASQTALPKAPANTAASPPADSATTTALALPVTASSAGVSVLAAAPAAQSSDPNQGTSGFRLSGLGPGVALPAKGKIAPDFHLTNIDGTSVNSSELRGKTVVLQFGSLSSPIYRSTVSAMNALSAEAPADTIFVLAYTQEAHPVGSPSPYADGEWVPMKDREEGVLIAQTTTLQERLKTAQRAASSLNDKRIVAVDDVDDAVWKAYGGRANSVFVISPEGKIVMASEYPDPSRIAGLIGKAMDENVAQAPRQ